MTENTLQEQRIHPRRRTLKRATLELNAKDVFISGLIRDVSDSGVRFAIDHGIDGLAIAIPTTARISVDGVGNVECEIVREWLNGELGIRFAEHGALVLPSNRDANVFYERESGFPVVMSALRELDLLKFEAIVAQNHYLWSESVRHAVDNLVSSKNRLEKLLRQVGPGPSTFNRRM